MGTFKYFIGIIVLQIFYSVGITLLSHGLVGLDPSFGAFLTDYENYATSLENMTAQIENSLNQQMNIPLIDLGSLVFYSGNIIVDLMLNFFFAVPSLITLLTNTIVNIFPLDAFIASYVKLGLFSLISITYFLSLLAFVTNIRSRGGIV